MNRILTRRGFVSLFAVFALAFGFAFACAQQTRADNLYARIQGLVTDPTGAVLVGVKLTATNMGTNVSYESVSKSDGGFVFLNLPVGTYKVSAMTPGFRTYTTTPITLTVDQVYVLNVKMELGQVSEQLTVEANPVEVNTTSAQLGVVVGASQIVDIPLLGRNWVNLQQIEPGVVAAADGRGDYATNGSETQQNSYLINGTDTNDLPLNTPLIIPSPDAIQEFRMVTNVINPEYGRNSGAIINAITKSGTNEFHGDAFDFYRDTFLNGRNFFAQTKQVFHQNQFGGTIGGPIWKNHTFFFFSYQGIHNRAPQTGGNVPVFSPAEAGGDFAAQLANLSPTDASPFPLFGNSESGCAVSSGTPCAAGTSYIKLFDSVPTAPDAGVVPTQDINPISAKLTSTYVPLPNVAGKNNYEFVPVAPSTQGQYMGRIDQNFGTRDTLWGEWFYQNTSASQELPFTGATLPGFASTSTSTDNQGTISWQHTFNDHMVNEARIGYTRLNFVAVNPQTPTLPSSFCASSASYVGGSGNSCFNITTQDPAGAGLPKLSVQGLFTLGFSNNGPQPRIDQTYEVTDNFSLTAGRHTIKLGFDMRRFEVFNPFFASNNGSYAFQNSNAPFGTGIAGLDFLLGTPASYVQGSGATINERNQEYYSYFQDEFKLRPNFTLTYGTGWQIDTPFHDLYANGHSQINFSPN